VYRLLQLPLVLLCLIVAITLSGCNVSSSTLKEMEQGAIAGTFNGQPVEIRWARQKNGEVKVDLNIPINPQTAAKVIASATPWGEIILGGMTLLTGALAGHQAAAAKKERNRADFHEKDAEEGYQKLDSANRQLVEMAKQLPPT